MRFVPASLSLALACLALGAPMARSQDAPASAPRELDLPELLPGYYDQTVNIQRLDIAMPATKLGDGRHTAPSFPATTERVCNTGDDLFRASTLLPEGSGIGRECRLVATSLVGSRGSGEFRCVSPEVEATIHYEGDFTATSRRATISMRLHPKNRSGEMNFKLHVAMERITESCTDDIPPAEDSATAAPDAVLDAAKKM